MNIVVGFMLFVCARSAAAAANLRRTTLNSDNVSRIVESLQMTTTMMMMMIIFKMMMMMMMIRQVEAANEASGRSNEVQSKQIRVWRKVVATIDACLVS